MKKNILFELLIVLMELFVVGLAVFLLITGAFASVRIINHLWTVLWLPL